MQYLNLSYQLKSKTLKIKSRNKFIKKYTLFFIYNNRCLDTRDPEVIYLTLQVMKNYFQQKKSIKI